MAFSKSVNLVHAQTAVPCDACEAKAPGEYYCIECKHTLCPPCEKIHGKFTKGHNVVLRTQIGKIDTNIFTCAEHGNQNTFHCEKCNKPVCGTCITEKHKGHDLTGLNDIFEKEKNTLQNRLTTMQQKSLPTLEKFKEQILELKGNYANKIKEITKDMESENRALHKELDRIHDDRMKRISSMEISHLLMFDGCTTKIEKKIELFAGKISEHREAIGGKSLPAILNLAKKEESLPSIHYKLEVPQPPSFVPGNAENLEEIIGRLLMPPHSIVHPFDIINPTIVSKFKCPTQGQPSLCITKEGDVWLGGLDSKKLVMVDVKGNVLRTIKVQNRICALAVLDCGDIIMSYLSKDSSWVGRLDTDGKEQQVFDSSPSLTNGVSVTADQKILICTEDGRVMRTNRDGSNVKQIYKGSGKGSALHAVENAERNIYITDKRNSSVVIISKDGKTLSTFTQTMYGQKFAWPMGLVVDKMGNALIADRENHCVYIIDQRLQIKVLFSCSDSTPRWIAIDNDDNLWIAQREGNILVIKYLAL
ncbi:hypothetical protein FSP39_006545 [Pinctada imbricata]|uniref:B box-type domain-containing protein n=1 Tax=Pinctada imbricata TaxID=66713 RepID=A0AA88XGD6_PINIB|nr:hypothetical protein FSP39_006545 [Pinctada imbricata]